MTYFSMTYKLGTRKMKRIKLFHIQMLHLFYLPYQNSISHLNQRNHFAIVENPLLIKYPNEKMKIKIELIMFVQQTNVGYGLPTTKC